MKYRPVMLVAAGAFLLAGMLLLNSHVRAQDDAVSNWRIAVVDRKAVFNEYKRQQEEMARLERELTEMQSELDAMSQRIESAKNAYIESRDGMTESERDAERSRIQEEFVQYEAELKSRQARVDSRTAALIRNIRNDIDEAVARYGEENRYHLIFESDTDPQSRTSVLYYHSRIDITLDIQRILNEAYAQAQ